MLRVTLIGDTSPVMEDYQREMLGCLSSSSWVIYLMKQTEESMSGGLGLFQFTSVGFKTLACLTLLSVPCGRLIG